MGHDIGPSAWWRHLFFQETPAHCVLYSSGLAAAFGIFSHFLPKRVFITGGYHGTHQVLAQLQKISDGARYKKEPLRGPEEPLGWGNIHGIHEDDVMMSHYSTPSLV